MKKKCGIVRGKVGTKWWEERKNGQTRLGGEKSENRGKGKKTKGRLFKTHKVVSSYECGEL